MIRIKRTQPHLKIENLGPIKSADVHFGDLTVLVGPQATGKSIFLQLIKLLVDTNYVKYEFRRAGIDWENKFDLFLDVYFGEGMRSLWNKESTNIAFNEAMIDLPRLVEKTRPSNGESMFF